MALSQILTITCFSIHHFDGTKENDSASFSAFDDLLASEEEIDEATSKDCEVW